MPVYKASKSAPGGSMRFPFVGAAVGLAGLVALVAFNLQEAAPEITVVPSPPVAARVLPEFNPHYIAIVRAGARAEYADAATAEAAKQEALSACVQHEKNRAAVGAYVTHNGCEVLQVLDNALGPSCGIVFQNNLVANVNAEVVTGANQYDVLDIGRSYLRSTAPGIFDSGENPRMSAMRLCVERDGKVKITDLSYELAR